MPQKNERVNLSALRPGDRFYILSDPLKHIWQLTDTPPVIRSFQSRAKQGTVKEYELKDDNGKKHFARPNTLVVFLRSSNTITINH